MVPNQKQLLALAHQMNIVGSWIEICNDPEMEKVVLREITDAGGLGELEMIILVAPLMNSIHI